MGQCTPAEGEPAFTIRAQDILAPLIVEMWCVLARDGEVHHAKLRAAEDVARAMRKWQAENHTKVKMPD